MPILGDRPYDQIQVEAEKQTLKHLRRAIEDAEEKGVKYDLDLVPVMQATTPLDANQKNANTGMNGVGGSPDTQPDADLKSNGLNDPKGKEDNKAGK